MHHQVGLRGGVEEHRAQLGAIGVGEGDVVYLWSIHERVGAAPGAVDHLVADHQVTGGQSGAEGPDGTRTDHPPCSKLVQCPQVGPVIDPVRRNRVAQPVPCNEGDLLATK